MDFKNFVIRLFSKTLRLKLAITASLNENCGNPQSARALTLGAAPLR